MKLCVWLNATCEYRHEVVAGDSCASITNAYKLTTDELIALNNNALNCSKLPLGRMICVRPDDAPPIPDFQCTQNVTGFAGNTTCVAISRKYQITVDELLYINPQLRCNSMPAGAYVCVKTSISQTCSAFVPVSVNDTCESLMADNGISELEFYQLNPFLRCDEALQRTFEVCIGQGYFHADQCVETLRVTGMNLNCMTLADQLPIDEATLKSLNPFLNCTAGMLDPNALVCVRSLGGLPTTAARDKVINALKVASPLLASRYLAYKITPNGNNTQALYAALSQELMKPGVYNALKNAYQSDTNVRKVVDSESAGMNRTEVCEDVRNRGLSSMIVNCVCNKADLLVYCTVLASNEFANLTTNGTNTNMRQKRSGPSDVVSCAPTFPTVNSPNTVISGCFGGGCTVPIPPILELKFRLGVCMPQMTWMASNMLDMCKMAAGNQACNVLTTYNLWKEEDVVGIVQTIVATGAVSICMMGSDSLEVAKTLGIVPCWDIATVSYAFFTGSLRISTNFFVFPTKLTLSFNVKVHNLVYPPLCDYGRYECQDYCIWQQNNEPAGAATGTFSISLFSIFGFSGWTIYQYAFKPPGKCYPGQVLIDIRNDRTCGDYNQVQTTVECFGTGKITYLKQNLYSAGLSFAFLAREQTELRCVVRIPVTSGSVPPTVCLYGPASDCGGRRGKGTYYYAVRNDGVYFGNTKGQEDQVVASFPPYDVCQDRSALDQLILSFEPTGPGYIGDLRCGKRRVGYYTGWGERVITTQQLRALTHIIFAFVGMQANGSLYFANVVQDELGYRQTQQELRFKYMRELARTGNTGIKIMVAIGGWDNSQYFSAICNDPAQRSQFVNNIAEFLASRRIDGVDIDWEYPVTGGAVEGIAADKQNLVSLLSDLRAKLGQLQLQLGRKTPYTISIAAAAGEWTIIPGYDLGGILQYVDFINVMTYDYYGAWEAPNGAFTGPPAPLYAGVPAGFSGKLNVDYTMKYYSCVTKQPYKLNLGIPFYGRFWNNVGDAIDPTDPMWRVAQPVNGQTSGGYAGFRDLQGAGFPVSCGPSKGSSLCPFLYFHQKTQTYYWWNPDQKRFAGLELPMSAWTKAKYAIQNNFGGLMYWALDLDSDNDQMLTWTSIDMCQNVSYTTVYDCTAFDVGVRWWTSENAGPDRQGMCGKSAPLINGYYPVCNPADTPYSCCGPYGYCGSGADYCNCSTCVNYGADPQAILQEPVKPTRAVQWYFMDAPDGQRGRCGPQIPKLNGSYAICNPDDPNMHCCSSAGYCGNGADYCSCAGCVDFTKTPNFTWSS